MEETGYDKETVSNVVESLEYKVLDTIALEDSVSFVFGTIYGVTKPSRKITGFVSVLPESQEQKSWSAACIGFPMIKFSKEAKKCDRVYPNEYFAWPENRYTSLARKYRQDVGDTEIPEYQGLSEEKIQELCKKADEEKQGPMSEKTRRVQRAAAERCRLRHIAERNAWFIEKDLERQRQAGIAEENLVRRSPEEIKEELKVEWWETYQDRRKCWEQFLSDPEKVAKAHAERAKLSKERKEWVERQAELKKRRNEVWQGDLNNDRETTETSDS